MLDEKDSISLRQFFEAMLDKEKEFSIIARGQGIGKWNGVQVTKDIAVTEQTTYGSAGKEDETFKRLRFSEVMINIERGIVMEVNSFTDPVKSNFSSSNPAITAVKNQYKLSNNDLLSAYRSAAILKKFKEEVSVLAGTYMTREEAKIIIDRFNRQFEKTKITVGHGSVKMTEF